MDLRRILLIAATILSAGLTAAFLYAQAYETLLVPCGTGAGASCSYDAIAAPWTGALAAFFCFLALVLAHVMKKRMPPAGWVVLTALAAFFSFLVVLGGQGVWVTRLWLPLFVLALVDSVLLIWASFEK